MNRQLVIAVGALPPPLFGNALALAKMVVRMKAAGISVLTVDTGPGTQANPFAYTAIRVTKIIRAVTILIRYAGKRSTLYHNLDAGMGVWYSIAVVAVARALGYRSFIHHHSNAYLTERRGPFALFFNLCGPNTVQIALSPMMASRLQALYGSRLKTFVLWNTALAEPSGAPKPIAPAGPLVLGHFGRLGMEKGLYDVLSTFEALAASGPVRLRLAGGAEDEPARRAIEDVMRRHPGRVDFLGRIADEDKSDFYESIDVFLLPTRLKVESQPMVLIEAMQHARPSIAFERALIPELLEEGGGVLADPSRPFEEAAVPILLQWQSNRTALLTAGKAARARFDNLVRIGREQLEAFTQQVITGI